MKYLILGARGMAGHTLALYLKEQGQEVMGFARQPSPVCETIVGDALDSDAVRGAIQSEKFDAVVNCIGVLNRAVDRNLTTGIYLNSYFPHFVADCCDDVNSKFIHISSDCVYSGKAAGYVEMDVPDEHSYYGRTKYLGEVTSGVHLSLRTSIVGPELKEGGIGLFNWFMHENSPVNGFVHVMWSGVTTLELARAVNAAAEQNLSGLYFLSNNEVISKHDLLCLFNKHCRNGTAEIIKSDLPISNKTLICTRNDFDYHVPGYEKMVEDMSEWIMRHKELYGQYI